MAPARPLLQEQRRDALLEVDPLDRLGQSVSLIQSRGQDPAKGVAGARRVHDRPRWGNRLDLDELAEQVAARGQRARHITALAGPPGAGKSTVAERLVDLIYMVPFIGLGLLLYPVPEAFRTGALIASVGAFVLVGFCIWMAGVGLANVWLIGEISGSV